MLQTANDYLADTKAYASDSNAEYRPKVELALIQSAIQAKGEEMATDFLDELEARGVVDASDYENKQDVVKEIVENYQNKFLRWLQTQ